MAFLCDLFLFLQIIDIAIQVDDNTPYTTNKSTSEVLSDIKMASKKLFTWFENNSMKANPDKFKFILSDIRAKEQMSTMSGWRNLAVKNYQV